MSENLGESQRDLQDLEGTMEGSSIGDFEITIGTEELLDSFNDSVFNDSEYLMNP